MFVCVVRAGVSELCFLPLGVWYLASRVLSKISSFLYSDLLIFFVRYCFVHRREEKFENVTPAKKPSSVHFFPRMIDLDNMQIRLSESFSDEIPISLYQITSAQNSGITVSSAGRVTSKSTIASLSRGDTSLVKQSEYRVSDGPHGTF